MVTSQTYKDFWQLLQNPKVPKIVLGFSNHAQRFTPPYYLDVDNHLKKSEASCLKVGFSWSYLTNLSVNDRDRADKNRDKQGQGRDKQGQGRDKHGHTGTSKDNQRQSLSDCPCLSLSDALSLYICYICISPPEDEYHSINIVT